MPTYTITKEGETKLQDLDRRNFREPISVHQEIQYSLLTDLQEEPQDFYFRSGSRQDTTLKMLERQGYIERIGGGTLRVEPESSLGRSMLREDLPVRKFRGSTEIY